MEELATKIIDLLISEGYANEESLRNFRIRNRYHVLREHEKVKVEECLEILSREFNMSSETIRHVIYKAKK